MTRQDYLKEAEKQITGQREQDYGKVEDNFATIAKLWTVYKGVGFTAHDVAMMMCLLKVARIKNGGGTGDSYADLIGYAVCAGELREWKPLYKQEPIEKECANCDNFYDCRDKMDVTSSDDLMHGRMKYVPSLDDCDFKHTE